MLIQPRIPSKLKGASLRGTIVDVKEETIKLHLKINQKLNHDYFWDWKPETNNVSYLMPEVGIDAMLYFLQIKKKMVLVLNTS